MELCDIYNENWEKTGGHVMSCETCEARWVTEEEFDRMIETEELAPSVSSHLAPLREAFNRILHQQ